MAQGERGLAALRRVRHAARRARSRSSCSSAGERRLTTMASDSASPVRAPSSRTTRDAPRALPASAASRSTRPAATSPRATASRAGTSSSATSRRSVTAASRRRRSCSPSARSSAAISRSSRRCSTSIRRSSPPAARTATTCSASPAVRRRLVPAAARARGGRRTAATTTAGRSSHQAGYSNDRALAGLALGAGADPTLSARGDGGTPLVAALFWGHREVVDLLGPSRGTCRVAAGLGRVDLIDELAGTQAAGAHRAFYRPHGGFPAWQPSDDPQEVLDEALVWAAKAVASRRSTAWSRSAHASTRIPIAGRRSPGPP